MKYRAAIATTCVDRDGVRFTRECLEQVQIGEEFEIFHECDYRIKVGMGRVAELDADGVLWVEGAVIDKYRGQIRTEPMFLVFNGVVDVVEEGGGLKVVHHIKRMGGGTTRNPADLTLPPLMPLDNETRQAKRCQMRKIRRLRNRILSQHKIEV